MSTVTKIPATISRFTATPIDVPIKRKVAAYARVSTDNEEQLTSYAAQISYYTEYIKSREDWEFVDVYTDEGISGCSTKHREGFQRMVEDALAAKIDLIITKSVSRFARNTVDSLSTIRTLKEHNVECYFEKENIWTFDSKGELLLTIMSSIAQEEARSISENVTWGHRKRFADGKVSVPFSRFLGYDRGEDGNLVINEQEAIIIREIFSLFLAGLTPHSIARHLTEKGIKTPGGKDTWSASTVKSILTNEKYKGDALLQKSYTVDFLTKKQKPNHGEVPMYYVENNHEGIITAEEFDAVQREIERRKSGNSRYSGVDILASKLVCGECGSFYSPKVWHSTDKYRRVIYQCGHKYKGEKRCSTPHLTAEGIKQIFIKAVNRLIENREELIANLETGIALISDNANLQKEHDRLKEEVVLYAELAENCIRENARTALNQEEYKARYNSLADQYEEAKKKLDTVEEQLTSNCKRKQMLEDFISTLKNQEPLTEFDENLWGKLLDSMTVFGKNDVRCIFKNGQEVKI